MLSTLKLFTLATFTSTALASASSADICFFMQGNHNCDRGQDHWCCEAQVPGQCCRNDAGPAYCEHIGVFGLQGDNVANFYNTEQCSSGLFDDIRPARPNARVCTHDFGSYPENARLRADQWKCSSFWTWRVADKGSKIPPDKWHKDYKKPHFPPDPEPERDTSLDRIQAAVQMRPNDPSSGRGGSGRGRNRTMMARGVAPAPPSNVTSCVGPTILVYTDGKGKTREVRFKESEIEVVKKALGTKDWKTLAKFPDSGRPVPGTPEFDKQEREMIMQMEAEHARQNRTGKL